LKLQGYHWQKLVAARIKADLDKLQRKEAQQPK